MVEIHIDEDTRRLSLIFLCIVFIILFFFLIREFACWFYKINSLIRKVSDNNRMLKTLCV